MLPLRIITILIIVSKLVSSVDVSACNLCNEILPLGKFLVELDEILLMKQIGFEICKNLKLNSDDVCHGMIEEYSPVLVQVFRQSQLTIKEMCAVTFSCFPQNEISPLNWNITIPTSGKFEIEQRHQSKTSANFSVLHLADLHIDLEYKPGANADCPKPICCRDGIGQPAEFWGDFSKCK